MYVWVADLNIENGATVFATAIAANKAGLNRTVVSGPLVIDSTPPVVLPAHGTGVLDLLPGDDLELTVEVALDNGTFPAGTFEDSTGVTVDSISQITFEPVFGNESVAVNTTEFNRNSTRSSN